MSVGVANFESLRRVLCCSCLRKLFHHVLLSLLCLVIFPAGLTDSDFQIRGKMRIREAGENPDVAKSEGLESL